MSLPSIATDGVSWPVAQSVTIMIPANIGFSDRDAAWDMNPGGPKELLLHRSPDPPRTRMGNFKGAAHCKV